jgi:molybdate/tungstate transport system substrate-binding protein
LGISGISFKSILLGMFLAAALAGCGSTASSRSTGSSASHPTSSVSGTANVAYAGSLQNVNELNVSPAFSKATGYKYQGKGGGAMGMAQEIKSKTIAPNVFESIGYAPVQLIEPKLTSWAIAFSSSPLVVAYNPNSKYAMELNAMKSGQKPLADLFTLMAQPGFHLGRTNPNTDPQGQAFYEMVDLAIKKYHLPSSLMQEILGPVDNSHEVYSETGILSLLQSGGLDAASAFLPEAVQRHLDYISLPISLNFSSQADATTYQTATVHLSNGSVVKGAPLTIDITTVGTPTPAAVSFIHFILGTQGQAIMKKAGYPTFSPVVIGNQQAVPNGILTTG